jgi:hypothetical protein
MADGDHAFGVGTVTAWTAKGLARDVDLFLTEHNVQPDNVISISHAREGFGFGPPYTALIVFRR